MKSRMPNKWPDWMMGAFCLGSVAVGAIGVWFTPSPTLLSDIGLMWSRFYSIVVMVAGVVALLGIVVARRQVTVIAIVSLALATVIRGVSIVAAGSWQTGIGLLIFPLIMVPGAMGWSFWMAWRSIQRKDDE